MARFLSIGECMVEMTPAGDGRFSMGFAGDTFNTAWYLRRLAGEGTEVAYLTAVGDDALSERMARFIAGEGIVPCLTRREGETVGLYLVSLDNGERSFTYWRSAAAARHLADDLSAVDALKAGDTAYLSGITAAIVGAAGRARLIEALEMARDRGVRVVFDPNLRPALWDSFDEMRGGVSAIAEISDIVLPSFDDEAAHFGDATPEETARRYGAAQLCVVKNGAAEIVVREGARIAKVEPCAVRADRIVDTTAAGDSFNAGMLAALDGGASIKAAVAAAAKLSAQVIAARGALVDPTRAPAS